MINPMCFVFSTAAGENIDENKYGVSSAARLSHDGDFNSPCIWWLYYERLVRYFIKSHFLTFSSILVQA